jgi:hypothetical protein
MSWVESIKNYIGADPSWGRVQPMYGVPIVKYGPPPSPTPYAPGFPGPADGIPGFDWSSIRFPPLQPSFSLPDFGHLAPSFPKLMAAVAFTAYVSLMAVAIFGLALRGSAWYLKKKK